MKNYFFALSIMFMALLAGCVDSTGELQNTSTAKTVPVLETGTITSTTVSLSWSAVTNAVYYNIYGGLTETGVLTKINTSPCYTTYTTISNLTPSSSYWYTVTAISADGESAYSNQVIAVTLAGTSTNTYVRFDDWTSSSWYGIKLGAAQKYDFGSMETTPYYLVTPGAYYVQMCNSSHVWSNATTGTFTLTAGRNYTLKVEWTDATHTNLLFTLNDNGPSSSVASKSVSEDSVISGEIVDVAQFADPASETDASVNRIKPSTDISGAIK